MGCAYSAIRQVWYLFEDTTGLPSDEDYKDLFLRASYSLSQQIPGAIVTGLDFVVAVEGIKLGSQTDHTVWVACSGVAAPYLSSSNCHAYVYAADTLGDGFMVDFGSEVVPPGVNPPAGVVRMTPFIRSTTKAFQPDGIVPGDFAGNNDFMINGPMVAQGVSYFVLSIDAQTLFEEHPQFYSYTWDQLFHLTIAVQGHDQPAFNAIRFPNVPYFDGNAIFAPANRAVKLAEIDEETATSSDWKPTLSGVSFDGNYGTMLKTQLATGAEPVDFATPDSLPTQTVDVSDCFLQLLEYLSFGSSFGFCPPTSAPPITCQDLNNFFMMPNPGTPSRIPSFRIPPPTEARIASSVSESASHADLAATRTSSVRARAQAYRAIAAGAPKADESAPPSGIAVVNDFLSAEEQAELLGQINSEPWEGRLVAVAPNVSYHKRFVQKYGASTKYDYMGGTTTFVDSAPLPDWMQALAAKIQASPLWKNSGTIVEATVQEYLPGQTLQSHIDSTVYGPAIAVVSLVSQNDFVLSREGKKATIPLPAGSLFVMDGEARYEWNHGIDTITQRRVSVSFRSVTPEAVQAALEAAKIAAASKPEAAPVEQVAFVAPSHTRAKAREFRQSAAIIPHLPPPGGIMRPRPEAVKK